MEVLDGKTAGFIRTRNREREDILRNLYNVDLEIVWEFDIRIELETNAEMRKFFDESFNSGAINMRDAFCGIVQNSNRHLNLFNVCGRTNVEKLYASVDGDKSSKIEYLDIVSLYPWYFGLINKHYG